MEAPIVKRIENKMCRGLNVNYVTPMMVDEKATCFSSLNKRNAGDEDDELSTTLQFSRVLAHFEVRFMKTFSLSHKKVRI